MSAPLPLYPIQIPYLPPHINRKVGKQIFTSVKRKSIEMQGEIFIHLLTTPCGQGKDFNQKDQFPFTPPIGWEGI
jgi:hypothetical protein